MYKSKIEKLRDEALEAIKPARELGEKCAAEGRALNQKERAQYDAAMAKGRAIQEQMRAAKADKEVLDGAKSLAEHLGVPGAGDDTGTAKTGRLGLTGKSGKALGVKIADQMQRDNGIGQKALAPAGTTVTDVPMLPESPVALGKPVASLFDVLPMQKRAPQYTYLRQSTRTNNAAPVTQGASKPTSVLGLTQVDAELQVVAHLSEPIPKHWLKDTAALEMFVAEELVYGLATAVEVQVLGGDGTPPNLTGMSETSGIQSQAFVNGSNLLAVTRAAITKLEVAGHEAGVFVLAPAVWESLELARTDTAGNLELGGPVDRAAKRLWGVPVVLSLGLPADTGMLLDTSAVGISVGDEGIETEWSDNTSDDFAKNQLRARVEGRFNVDVFQPLGVVSIATVEAAA
ncbi:MAG: phage major capsid protein [Rhodococcus sp.]|nr:phage major capsid protein [Rhodococcus sp. (in: high G+C Gram-positive bacteria)]